MHVPGAQARLPRSEAKERLATVEAARAVAACLTPGMPPVEHVSILPRGEYMARIIYQPQARSSPALWSWPLAQLSCDINPSAACGRVSLILPQATKRGVHSIIACRASCLPISGHLTPPEAAPLRGRRSLASRATSSMSCTPARGA